jgi:hypothetical protein
MEIEAIDRILDQIDAYAKKCDDIVCTSNELHPSVNDGKITFNLVTAGEKEPILLQQSASGQFLTKLQIPSTFFRKLSPELQIAVINYFNKDKEFLLRCIDNGEQECRAVLSRIFTTEYDNKIIFPPILKAFATPDISYEQFILEDHIARLDTRFDDINVDYQDEHIIGGINVTNSETGFSSVWIDPVVVIDGVYVLGSRTCARKIWKGFRIVHKGLGINQEDTVRETLADIEEAKKAVQVGIIQYMEATQEPVNLTDATVFASSLDMLPKRFVGILENEWLRTVELKRTKVIKDILKAAADLPILAKTYIEQSCGSWIGLFSDYQTRLLEITKL